MHLLQLVFATLCSTILVCRLQLLSDSLSVIFDYVDLGERGGKRRAIGLCRCDQGRESVLRVYLDCWIVLANRSTE